MAQKTYAERNREANRRYFAKMGDEERKEYFRERYRKNKDKYNARSKQWRADNPEHSQAATHNTTIRKNYPEAYSCGDIDNRTLRDWLKKNRGQPCTYCGDPGTHIEHKHPLSRGGTHSFQNIVIACGDCNEMKSNHLLEEWLDKISKIAKNTSLMNHS